MGQEYSAADPERILHRTAGRKCSDGRLERCCILWNSVLGAARNDRSAKAETTIQRDRSDTFGGAVHDHGARAERARLKNLCHGRQRDRLLGKRGKPVPWDSSPCERSSRDVFEVKLSVDRCFEKDRGGHVDRSVQDQ